jgi:hypothetical protein
MFGVSPQIGISGFFWIFPFKVQVRYDFYTDSRYDLWGVDFFISWAHPFF